MSLEKTNFYRGVDPLDPSTTHKYPSDASNPHSCRTTELGYVTRIAANVLATQLIVERECKRPNIGRVFSVGIHG